jgi:hypothetical protein
MARKKVNQVAVVSQEMNENLKAVFEAELDARNHMIRDTLRFHRDRGKVISRVRAGKSLDGRSSVDYGKNPVEVLSDRLNISCSYVYKLATFYEIYEDSDKFQDLMDKFNDNQFHLSWSHFNCLVHVTDSELREEIIEEAVQNKLSVRGLHELLADKKIKIDDENLIESSEDVVPIVECPAVEAAARIDMEETTRPEHVEALGPTPGSPSSKAVLKKLVVDSGKFGDKLVDLVGDLTISLNGVHGSEAHKDIFKGLSSAKEVLQSLEQTIGEYHTQIANLHARLIEERAADDSE